MNKKIQEVIVTGETVVSLLKYYMERDDKSKVEKQMDNCHPIYEYSPPIHGMVIGTIASGAGLGWM
ncbi:MAG: hypothetical protein ABH836_00035 [Candidatus Omnitrophota bacterium]